MYEIGSNKFVKMQEWYLACFCVFYMLNPVNIILLTD